VRSRSALPVVIGEAPHPRFEATPAKLKPWPLGKPFHRPGPLKGQATTGSGSACRRSVGGSWEEEPLEPPDNCLGEEADRGPDSPCTEARAMSGGPSGL